jgi:type I restriction-modification system DNA methylase subunit
MITGEIRNQVDRLWDAFWSGGISNPLEVIEQITYLLFIKRLDDLQTLEEAKSQRLGKPIERRVFPTGKDGKGRKYDDLRWSRFKHFEANEMLDVVSEHVFPFLRTLGGDDSTYAHHMKDARFTIPRPALLAKAVDLIDQIPMQDRDTKGDLYEYMLGKIASAGQNGQFRTPRHIIRLMVELTDPKPEDVICDPACGTAGFLVTAAEYLREKHPEMLRDAKTRQHFHHGMFHGFDFDSTMLRIGSMNMLLHGVENPDIVYRDSLAQDHAGEEEKYTLVLANPPFAGSLDYESVAKDLLQVVKTKKTELLFLALFLRLLKPGGRAAVIVPAGVLGGEGAAHRELRKLLVDNNRLEAVIALPHWVFKPYASVATAILVFDAGGQTEATWFYRLDNDGFLDDASKTPIDGSDVPEVLSLWSKRNESGYAPSANKHRTVTRTEIVDSGYDLTADSYLSSYIYPSGVPLVPLGDLFDIHKGKTPASQGDGGGYPLVTSAADLRAHSTWDFEGEAVCIPTVSSTGHGHASIKNVHYVKGRFAAASIVAVLLARNPDELHVPYVYHYLVAHKEDLLVPLMRGAANVSLNTERLARLKIPVPSRDQQEELAMKLSQMLQRIAELQRELASDRVRLEEAIEKFREEF